jgi:hypothetical protein
MISIRSITFCQIDRILSHRRPGTRADGLCASAFWNYCATFSFYFFALLLDLSGHDQ